MPAATTSLTAVYSKPLTLRSNFDRDDAEGAASQAASQGASQAASQAASLPAEREQSETGVRKYR